MSTLTIHLEDESLLEKAARVARAQKTSEDAMIGGFLAGLSETKTSEEPEELRRQKLAEDIQQTFREYSRPWGGRGYTNRDELYDRE